MTPPINGRVHEDPVPDGAAIVSVAAGVTVSCTDAVLSTVPAMVVAIAVGVEVTAGAATAI